MYDKKVLISTITASLVYAFVTGLLGYLIQEDIDFSEMLAGAIVFFAIFYLLSMVIRNRKKEK